MIKEEIFKIGRTTVICTDVFKSNNEDEIKNSVQNIIAKLICEQESDEVTTYTMA